MKCARGAWRARFLALAAFAIIGIVAAGQAWATTRAPAAVADGDGTRLVVHGLTVVKGDTLSKLLLDAGIAARDAEARGACK